MTLVMSFMWVSSTHAAFTSGRKITIDANQVSGSGGSLPNFPVAVNLTDKDLRTVGNGGKVTDADGYDIIFRAYDSATCGGPSTCILDHEIERYDGLTGALVAWVRIPSLSQDNDTVFTMHFGDPTIVTSQENVAGVWDPNSKAVWHLTEDKGGVVCDFRVGPYHNRAVKGLRE